MIQKRLQELSKKPANNTGWRVHRHHVYFRGVQRLPWDDIHDPRSQDS